MCQNDWLTDVEVVSKLNQLILDLEHSENNQLEIDNKYDELVNVIQDEMNSKPDLYCGWYQHVKLLTKTANKRKDNTGIQEELCAVQNGNPLEFWKKIGRIGVGNERQKSIPMEVLQDDGSICTDTDVVLNKWKISFDNLLNCKDKATCLMKV
ncbi:unnamed protein product [Mytilus coruscus]|uniref:Uncharacterized protein n=1 Tax=Mytilus coruscus TaxID=42192 RepID=A0A6J8ALZ7_MYTCO|nr:unnamed protein product [Mytilus coruscus]